MNINVSNNAADIARQLGRMASDIERAQEKALDRAAEVAINAKRRQVDKTYARAIPLDANGQPKWERSGDFQREQIIESKTGERTIRGVGNSEKYEGRLASLPTGADGVNRSNPAAEEAARIVEPQIEPIFKQEMRNELGL